MPLSPHSTQAHTSQPLNQWISLKKKKKFPSHPHSVWTSNLPLLRICLTVFFSFFVFPSYPHSVLVSVSPFVLRSLLLSFIRYWFFSFDFDFDYLILFLSFDHFLGIFILFYFIFSGFISHSSFMLVVEHLVHMMILISIFSMTNESCVIKWTFKLSSCLFETLKLICYLDVMNLFAICHLDVNVMTDW